LWYILFLFYYIFNYESLNGFFFIQQKKGILVFIGCISGFQLKSAYWNSIMASASSFCCIYTHPIKMQSRKSICINSKSNLSIQTESKLNPWSSLYPFTNTTTSLMVVQGHNSLLTCLILTFSLFLHILQRMNELFSTFKFLPTYVKITLYKPHL